MKLIYIAGPLRAKTLWERTANMLHAEEMTLFLVRLGAAVHCPHTQYGRFDGEIPEEKFMALDFEVIKRCDGVFFLKGWKNSKGSTAEHDFASSHGKRIFYEGTMTQEQKEEFLRWIRSDEVC